MKTEIVVLGAGGHAKVLLNALALSRVTVKGLVDPDPAKAGTSVLGVPVLGGEEKLPASTSGKLVNGLGSVAATSRRAALFEEKKKQGYSFLTVTHPTAIIAPDVELGEGAQVMAGAIIQPGCRIGANVIINTGAIIDHDCVIGESTHVAPGVVLSGGVRIGKGSHLGTGATVIQGIELGQDCVVAAGAVVTAPVRAGAAVYGVPAKEK